MHPNVSDLDQGTDVRKFLLIRGQMMLKQHFEVGEVNALGGSKLRAEIITISVGDSSVNSSIHGLRLEEVDSDGDVDDSNFLDADEIPELVSALEYLEHAGNRLRTTTKAYTEATYVSKDNAKFGLYQDRDGSQMLFIDVGGDGRNIYMPVESLGSLGTLLRNALSRIEAVKQADFAGLIRA